MAKNEVKGREKLSLDSILEGFEEEAPPSINDRLVKRDVNFNDPPDHDGSVGYMNIAETTEECNNKAEDMVNYMVEFYLSGAILNNPYIKKRMDDDKNTLADLLKLMKSSDHSISKLMEVIDTGGAIVPRNFEVLAKLHSSKMEIVKHYEAVKTNIENNYKAMKSDYDDKFGVDMIEGSNSPAISSEGYGHKALLKNLAENMNLNTDFIAKDSTVNKNKKVVEEAMPQPEYSLPKGVILYDANRPRVNETEAETSEQR